MQLSVISHFYNEELLLKQWIDHHAKIFDYGILIDYHSTDRSRSIAESNVPGHWKVITSRNSCFDAPLVDDEVMDLEQELTGWKMALNTTEFMFTPNLREKLDKWSGEFPDALAFGSRAACLIDPKELPIKTPIWKNRTKGLMSYEPGEQPTGRQWRYIHKAPHGQYTWGRHSTPVPHVNLPDFLHLYFLYSPWPQCVPRKLQIQNVIPENNKVRQLGVQHLVTAEQLSKHWYDSLPRVYDLKTKPIFKQYYEEMIKL